EVYIFSCSADAKEADVLPRSNDAQWILPPVASKYSSSTLTPNLGHPKEWALEAEEIQRSRISVGTQTEDLTVLGKDRETFLSNGGLQQAEETSSTRGKSFQDSSNVGELDLAEVLGGRGPFRVAKNSFGLLTETENTTSELQTVQENPEARSANQFPSSTGLQEAQDVGEPPPEATKEKPPSPGQPRLGGPPPGPGTPSPEPPSEGSSSSSTAASPVPVVHNVMATKKGLVRRNSSSDKLARTKQHLQKKAASTANLFNRSSSLENRSKDPTLSPGPTGSRRLNYNLEGLSIKMFLRGRPITMYIPSDFHNYEDLRMELPTQKLQLDWVYGYRGRDCRSNLYVLTSGELVYFIACVVVLYHVQRRTQRHYLRHTDCVRCLAVHPDGVRVASGQMAGVDKDGKPLQPFVHIWDSVTLLTLQQIGLGSFERGVGSLAFSTADEGAYLCVIDESNEHMLSVWDCVRGTKQAEIKSTNESVLMVEFNPQDSSNIITAGKSHVYFWTWVGSSLTKKQGIFGVKESW
ncbi:echinoderm microtubule-associated protein-like 3, partial [Notechis scutatus]|uniref:Echinoderm microtubule-associated protein-like 3 n=1 Tax=Notechis scutatus TaxID=8663 RepID=A0A6J1VYT9_9SAUR